MSQRFGGSKCFIDTYFGCAIKMGEISLLDFAFYNWWRFEMSWSEK